MSIKEKVASMLRVTQVTVAVVPSLYIVDKLVKENDRLNWQCAAQTAPTFDSGVCQDVQLDWAEYIARWFHKNE